MVISKITFNTGSTTFDSVEDFTTFFNSFNRIQQIRDYIQNAKANQIINESTTTQISPSIFEHVFVSPENITSDFEAELTNLIQTLGWTREMFVSYQYT